TASIEVCVYKFRKSHLTAKCPTVRQVYNWINNGKIFLTKDKLCYKKARGKNNKSGMMKHTKWNLDHKTVLPISLRPKYINKRYIIIEGIDKMIIIKIIDKLINFIVITFFLIAIFFAVYALYDVKLVFDASKLSGDILKYKPNTQEDGKVTFNLLELQQNVNEDICGWISIDGTNIDYPILYSENSLEYLSKTYDGKYSPGGSIFVDTKNDRYFNDDFTIIYGHNLSGKLMFSDIKLFKDPEFFKEHPTGKLYIQDKIYDLEIYTFNSLDSNKEFVYRVDSYKVGHNDKLIKRFEETATNKSDLTVSPDDKFVMLSTCNGVGTSKRAVLFARLTESTSTDLEVESLDKDEKNKEKQRERQEFDEKVKKYNPEIKKLNKKDGLFTKIKNNVKKYLLNPYNIILFILIIITIGIYIKIYMKNKKR
ncbi:MAG: class B sortase, partial [Bacilli bacterium]|nr:class B sortase [Bacilli bacterium]